MVQPSLPETASRWPFILRLIGPGALIFCATFLAYLPALSGEFIWNDIDYVTAPALRSLDGLVRIWTQPGATQQYYPLLHGAFWVQHRLWGDHPLGYHVVTLLLHASSAVMFALVLRRLLAGKQPGPYAGAEWLAALLFALHPVHVESVAWIAEQKNTLSLALYLAAALVYLRFDEGRRPRDYVFALALFVCSLLCKTVTATLPAALLVAIWWRRGRLGWRPDVLPLLPWLALGAAAGLFSSWVEQAYVGAQGADFNLPVLSRVLVAGRAIWFYAGKLAWPFGLNFVYPRWNVDAAVWWQWLFPLGVLAAAAALWAMRRRTRGPLAAFLLFVGSLFPALSFVNLYGARYSWVWDHWQYLPDLGPLALAAAGLTAGWRRVAVRPSWLGPGLVAALAMALGALTWAHCAMFHDNQALYLTTLARNPGSWMAHNNLGLAWSKMPGRLGDAVAQYEEALRLKPDIAETHTNLGNAWSEMPGRLGDAIAQYEEALRLQPHYADAHFYLANALVRTGRIPEAIRHYEEALRVEPDLAEASNNLGMILCRIGRTREGIERIEAAIRADPDFAQAHFARGAALLQAGRRDEAVAEYRRVL
ncbi:MAG TPA: tetratricopeptide repeat protein, partial [Candidatus Sulfotelmatobacter sp.]|nr:tetratricopeptide repeat protein [Candidatus Sulfotelmatobacter sp.]